MLKYTLDRTIEGERAVFIREAAVADFAGGVAEPSWATFATVPCKFWWWHSSGARSAAREYGEPERNVNIRGGGLIIALGTPVTVKDKVARITDASGNTLVEAGTFRVVAVEEYTDHLELALYQP